MMSDEIKISKYLIQYSLFGIPESYFVNFYHCNNYYGFL